MHRVHDDQTTRVSSLSSNANTLAGILDLWGGFHAHDSVSIAIDLNEVGGLLLTRLIRNRPKARYLDKHTAVF